MEEMDWRELITDPQQRQVFEALEDEKWDWRTVGALSKLSGLSEDDVRELAEQHRYLIRRSRGKSGRELYTLQKRYYERKSLAEQAWDFLSSSSS